MEDKKKEAPKKEAPKPAAQIGGYTMPLRNPLVDMSQPRIYREKMGSNFGIRAMFEVGFNDYVKEAMNPEERSKHAESSKIMHRVYKYSAIGGFAAAFVPSLIRFKVYNFRYVPWFIRWPIRFALLVIPALFVPQYVQIFRTNAAVQNLLFEKYSTMDPKAIQILISKNANK